MSWLRSGPLLTRRAALGAGTALAGAGLISGTAIAAAGTNSGNCMAVAHGGMFRWWIPAGFSDPDTIVAEIESVARAGFRGLEICINMDDSRYPASELPGNGWGSPRWNALYRLILETANAQGLTIDTTISPAWPAAVPSITQDEPAASQELICGESDAFTGHYSGAIPAGQSPGSTIAPGPPPGGPPGMTGEEEPSEERLLAVTAARVLGRTKVTKSIVMQWGDMPGDPREIVTDTLLLDPDSLTVVPASNWSADTGQVDWQAPGDGEWKLFAFWERGTGQSNKGGVATAERNIVIDHFGRAGTQAILDYWEISLLDNEIRQLMRANGGAIFEDSLELEYRGMIWTPAMLEEFRERRGYDLAPYLPLFVGMNLSGLARETAIPVELGDGEGGVSNLGARVRRDLSECLTGLYIDNHIMPIKAWAEGLGQDYRAQSYGAAFDMSATGAASGSADGESLGFGPGVRGDDRFRMVAGAVHAAGEQIIADEAGAIANEGYRLTWADMLHWVNRNYGAGANRMIFHGLAHGDVQGASWPGFSPFGFGLAEHWGPRHPNWRHIDDIAAYLARVQQSMQEGEAAPDFAVLQHQYGTASPVLAPSGIADLGYCYDIVSPGTLEAAMGHTQYGALVVMPTEAASPETVSRLMALAEAGQRMVLVGEAPRDVAFRQEDVTELSEFCSRLASFSTVRTIAGLDDLPGALSALGVQPSVSPATPGALLMQHRRSANGDIYLIANPTSAWVTNAVRFAGTGPCVAIDPWTGREEFLGADDGAMEITLAPDQLVIVRRGEGIAGRKRTERFAAVTLPQQWHLTVERWQDVAETPAASDTHVSLIEVGQTALLPWQAIQLMGPACSGMGRYVVALELSREQAGADALELSVPTKGWASARLRCNGQSVGIDPLTGKARLSGPFHEGRQMLEVEIATTLGNQLIADGKITDSPWDPNAKAVVEDYGLLAPVTLQAVLSS